MTDIIPLRTVSYGPWVSLWCLWEYPNHPDGCVNYHKKLECPPNARRFPEMFDVENYEVIEGHNSEMFLLKLKQGCEPTLWLIYEVFDMKAWIKKLQGDNPAMSKAQCRIPYLWQPKVEARLEVRIQRLRWDKPYPVDYLLRPEANEVNVFGTWEANAIQYGLPHLEKNPEDEICLIAMFGKAGEEDKT